MPIALSDVTLAILAGGEGSRMGKPKAELQIAGQPILLYLLDRFAWPGPTILVTAPGRQKPPGAERFDREVTDAVGGQGPLRGVFTALEACHTEYLFITTVDMPGVRHEHAHWLVQQLASDLSPSPACGGGPGRGPFVLANDLPQAKGPLPNLPPQAREGNGAAGVMCRRSHRVEPFPSAFQATAVAGVRAMLTTGARSVQSLARTVCDTIPCPDWPPEVWANLNRPEDLAAWAATL